MSYIVLYHKSDAFSCQFLFSSKGQVIFCHHLAPIRLPFRCKLFEIDFGI